MLLNESSLSRIDTAVLKLTGFHMQRGMTRWEDALADALDVGVAALESLRMIEGLILKTEVPYQVQRVKASGDGQVPSDQSGTGDT